MLLGFFAGLALSPHLALLAGTAFVGSYTTFSTWMLETHRLAEERQIDAAVANIVVSVVLGAGGGLARPVDRGHAVTDISSSPPISPSARRHGDRFAADALLDLYGETPSPPA